MAVKLRPRHAIRGLAWITIAGAIGMSWLSPSARVPGTPELPGLIVHRDRPYRPGSGEPRVDLYLPGHALSAQAGSTGGRRPVIVAIHGGSWSGGSRAEFGPQMARFARHGYAVVVPDYSLARPGNPTWDVAVDELRDAVRWVRDHAETYHLDSDHVAVLGAGAGGHLALLLGMLPDSTPPGRPSARVQAVIDFYGPVDLAGLRAARGLQDDPVDALLGKADPGRLRATSPLEHLSGDDPPTLILHGSDDLWVASDQSRELEAQLGRAGVRHRLIILPGARHGFGLTLGPPESRDLVAEILEFLDSAWDLPVGPAPPQPDR